MFRYIVKNFIPFLNRLNIRLHPTWSVLDRIIAKSIVQGSMVNVQPYKVFFMGP